MHSANKCPAKMHAVQKVIAVLCILALALPALPRCVCLANGTAGLHCAAQESGVALPESGVACRCACVSQCDLPKCDLPSGNQLKGTPNCAPCPCPCILVDGDAVAVIKPADDLGRGLTALPAVVSHLGTAAGSKCAACYVAPKIALGNNQRQAVLSVWRN